MKQKIQTRIGCVLVVVSLVVLYFASCTTPTDPTNRDSNELVRSNDATLQPFTAPHTQTAQPTTTAVPAVTLGQSESSTTRAAASSSIPAHTPWLTTTPTLTPQPTLSVEEGNALVLDLLQDNKGCRLPCWWGFVPGETVWSEAESFLTTFASEIESTGRPDGRLYSVYIPVSEEVHPSRRLVYEYRVRDSVIEMIEVMFGSIYQDYELSEFLNTYGKPEEMWIRTFESAREGTLPFYIVLFYPRQGIMIRYYDNAERVGQQIKGCPQQKESRPLLWLWSSETELSFEAVAARTVNFGMDEEEAYLPLEMATGMSVDTFYETFKNAFNQRCLETPAELWPPPV